MGGHGKCYLVANGDDGKKYYRFVKKYSDDEETKFKRAVAAKAGKCRTVSRANKEPMNATEI